MRKPMKKHRLILLFIIFCIFDSVSNDTVHAQTISPCKNAITYAPHGGRFGDQICGYARAKWLAFKYKLPFIFNPIVPNHPELLKLFQKLNMFYVEKYADKEITKSITTYNQEFIVKTERDLAFALKEKTSPTLFICSHSTKLDITNTEILKNKGFTLDYNADLLTYLLSLKKSFGVQLKNKLMPVNPISQILPQNKISIAVHVRTGGGYDVSNIPNYQQYFDSKKYDIKYRIIQINNKKINFINHKNTPMTDVPSITSKRLLRFIPKQYYVDQIIKLSKIFQNRPLFVHIFTDEKDISKLVMEFKKRVNLPNIEWYYRTNNNAHNLNIVEDFYLMSQYDCLIRSQSNFSLGASLLGQHKIIITPRNCEKINEKFLLINEVEIIYNNTVL